MLATDLGAAQKQLGVGDEQPELQSRGSRRSKVVEVARRWRGFGIGFSARRDWTVYSATKLRGTRQNKAQLVGGVFCRGFEAA